MKTVHALIFLAGGLLSLAAFAADAPPNPATGNPPANPAAASPVPTPPTPTTPAAASPPPPVTATGEQAPALRVPPPPQLEPMVTPSLPPGVTSLVPTPLTLEQAIRIGLQHQPTVGIAVQAVEAERGVVEQARSALGTTVSVGSSYARDTVHGPTGAPAGTGPASATVTSDNFASQVQARQLLFDFGHTRATVRSAQLQEKATQTDLVRARSDAVYNIRQAYFTLLEDQQLVVVAQKNVNAEQGHLDESNAMFSAGRASQLDVLQAQTALGNAELTLANADTNQSLALAALNEALGIDVRTPTVVTDVPAPPDTLPEMNAMVAQALDRRPEVIEARQVLQADESSLSSARTSNQPSVVANGSLGWQGGSFPGDDQSSGIGVNLAWDPFDAGLTHGLVRQARATLETAKLQLYQAQQTVSNDVITAFLNAQNARQQEITSASEVASAQEALNTAEGRYRAGVGISLDVIDAQSSLVQAQASQVNAIYSFQIALAALDHAVGGTAR